jgi:hypothetical protein
MIDPFDISSNDTNRVGERSRIPPYEFNKFNEFNGAPFGSLRPRSAQHRSGKAFSIVYSEDHFLFGLSLILWQDLSVLT